MKNKKLLSVLTVLILATIPLLGAAPERPSQPHVAGTVIFKLHTIPNLDGKTAATGVPKVDALLADAGCSSVRQLFPSFAKAADPATRNLAQICEATVALPTDIPALCRKLMMTGEVVYAEPRYIEEPLFVPNDPQYGQQWFLPKIQAPLAWDITQGDTTIIIGIVDTGVDWDHPDLAANIWINRPEFFGVAGVDDDGNGYVDDIRGWDFGYNDNNPIEDSPTHGTHVAGCASEVTNNGIGGAGIGFKTKLMALKGRSAQGLTHVYDCIPYAANMGAHIINCSWGSLNFSQYANDIIQYAFGRGCIITAAAGNGGADQIGDNLDSIPYYPTCYENVVTVAASNSSDIKSNFSNYGRAIDVIAPGVSIYSTWQNDTYTSADGTSMASPIAAGVAALVKAVRPTWSNTTISTHLRMTGDNIDHLNPIYAGKIGRRVNAYRAVIEPALPMAKYQSHTIVDGNNSIPEPGETFQLIVTLKNFWGDAAAVSATLSNTDPYLQITNATSNFGAISGGASQNNSSNPFILQVHPNSLPHLAKLYIDISDGGMNLRDSIIISIDRSPILLVDDDTGGRNVEGYYTTSLTNLGYAYDYHDYYARGRPDSAMLKAYPIVIWSCEWAFPSLDSLDRVALRAYLNNGGRLYLSGQDIGWDLCHVNQSSNATPDAISFYQNYLKATYVGDHSNVTTVVGKAGDPIGNGLSFSIFQPGLSASYQYYDYFNPRPGADTVLSYSGFTLGRAGIKYSGPYRVVYTGFGFEAITSAAVRDTFMDRVVKWFAGDINVSHTPLTDTENTTDPYIVQATVTSSAGVGQVWLYWDNDASQPFANKVAMTHIGGNVYQAAIPPHNGANIWYFIYASNATGLYKTLPGGAPNNYYSFYAGPDPFPPAITHTPLPNTINLSGPFRVTMAATDNYGVFPDSSFLRFRVNSQPEQTPIQLSHVGGNNFAGLLTLPQHINTWDTIYYYLTAVDMSSQRNVGRSPNSGYHSFVAVDSVMVCRFDTPAEKAMWDTINGSFSWRTFTTAYSAPHSMRTGLVNYPNNADFRMTLKPEYSYNLNVYADNNKGVNLYYRHRGRLPDGNTGDTLMVEASKDNITWFRLKNFVTYNNLTTWRLDTVPLASFLSGKGANDSIIFRFRLTSDAATNQFGWMIDDVYLKVEPVTGVAGLPMVELPATFGLSPNRPNPFTGRTEIRYQLPIQCHVDLNVYNITGQLVRTLQSGPQPPGYYRLVWDGRDNQGKKLPTGVYLYRLETGTTTLTRKMVMMK